MSCWLQKQWEGQCTDLLLSVVHGPVASASPGLQMQICVVPSEIDRSSFLGVESRYPLWANLSFLQQSHLQKSWKSTTNTSAFFSHLRIKHCPGALASSNILMSIYYKQGICLHKHNAILEPGGWQWHSVHLLLGAGSELSRCSNNLFCSQAVYCRAAGCISSSCPFCLLQSGKVPPVFPWLSRPCHFRRLQGSYFGPVWCSLVIKFRFCFVGRRSTTVTLQSPRSLSVGERVRWSHCWRQSLWSLSKDGACRASPLWSYPWS